MCLPVFDPNKRANISYYPDLHNFTLHERPNRSIPVEKFLNLFRGFLKNEVLDQLAHDLTNYRLEFYTTREDWIEAYTHTEVESCMSNTDVVGCYAHPENKLALAALFAPDGVTMVARTIVNTEEKWYVRLFGDRLLVDKLQEQGYRKLNDPPRRFKMYAVVDNPDRPDLARTPYFDFAMVGREVVPDTYNRSLNTMEIIINPGIH